jgi:Ca2+-binding EF-hand superfamily protein
MKTTVPLLLTLSLMVMGTALAGGRGRRPDQSKVFHLLDSDKNNQLCSQEFQVLLDPKAMRAKVKAEMRRRMGPMAGLMAGRMSGRLVQVSGLTMERRTRLQARFDKNGDGKLGSKEQLAATEDLIRRLDADGNKELSLAEFKALKTLQPPRNLPDASKARRKP